MKLEQEQRYYRIKEPIKDNNTPICQYMRLDYLFKLLETQKYYVNRKRFFLDKREKDYPEKLKYAIEYFPGDGLKNQPLELQKTLSDNIRLYKEKAALLTACWTLNQEENVLMWERGTAIKACIKSTIGQFIASFDNNLNLYIWCGDIEYKSFDQIKSWEEKLWYKQPCFQAEKEFRFYFSKSLATLELDDYDLCKPYLFDINPKEMITEIVLDPNIDKVAATTYKEMIHQKYGIITKLSQVDY